MKIQKGDYVALAWSSLGLNWTRRVRTNKAYKVIDIYPMFIMEPSSPSKIERYLIIEDEEHTITGYRESKFTLSPNNLKLKRLEKLKKLKLC